MKRLGILGGTFDPVHNGHLIAAQEALVAYELDRVSFVPAGHPWQKARRKLAPAQDRLRMTELATASNGAFGVSRLEIDRDGPTFAVDTVRDFEGAAGELYFIVGTDAATQIHTWKEPEEMLRLATFVAVTRPGYESAGLDARVRVLQIPGLAVSSTDIRARVASGRPIRYLVPDEVASYIAGHGLYRAA